MFYACQSFFVKRATQDFKDTGGTVKPYKERNTLEYKLSLSCSLQQLRNYPITSVLDGKPAAI